MTIRAILFYIGGPINTEVTLERQLDEDIRAQLVAEALLLTTRPTSARANLPVDSFAQNAYQAIIWYLTKRQDPPVIHGLRLATRPSARWIRTPPQRRKRCGEAWFATTREVVLCWPWREAALRWAGTPVSRRNGWPGARPLYAIPCALLESSLDRVRRNGGDTLRDLCHRSYRHLRRRGARMCARRS